MLLTYLEELEAKVRPSLSQSSAMQGFCKLLDWRLYDISQCISRVWRHVFYQLILCLLSS